MHEPLVNDGGKVEPFSPEELARWCQRTLPGDIRAFQLLVTTYKAQVLRTALRMLGNRQDAEDLAQEVFLAVFRRIRDLDDPATLTAWIYRITVNMCLNARARQKRRPDTIPLAPSDLDDQIEGFVDTTVATPEEAVLRRELQRCIAAVLAQLNSVERAIIVLRDFEDRSYQEIADSLSVGLSAAKMRIHRARAAFQQLFDRICSGLRLAD
jgi:RNA polymerase sigma-70 factor, ECF subfamily